MTNEVFECHWALANKRGKPRKVLLRLYGESSELFFNRENEILTFEKMSQHGQGPRLLARFSTGRVEEFLNARVLLHNELKLNDWLGPCSGQFVEAWEWHIIALCYVLLVLAHCGSIPLVVDLILKGANCSDCDL